MMQTKQKQLVTVEIPAEVARLLGGQSAAQQVVLQSVVVELVRTRVISAGKGAELLGLNRWDFYGILAAHDVATVELTADELVSDHRNLQQVLKKGL